MHGFRNSLKLLSRCMNGQLNPSCTIKFSLNCQQFFFFFRPFSAIFSLARQCATTDEGAHSIQGQPSRFIGKHFILLRFIKGDRNEPPTLGDTQIKPRQIMAERQQCAVAPRKMEACGKHIIASILRYHTILYYLYIPLYTTYMQAFRHHRRPSSDAATLLIAR